MAGTSRSGCPKCGEDSLTAITFAYHDVVEHGTYGMMMVEESNGDEFALTCQSCGWTAGDVNSPNLLGRIEDVLEAERDKEHHP